MSNFLQKTTTNTNTTKQTPNTTTTRPITTITILSPYTGSKLCRTELTMKWIFVFHCCEATMKNKQPLHCKLRQTIFLFPEPCSDKQSSFSPQALPGQTIFLICTQLVARTKDWEAKTPFLHQFVQHILYTVTTIHSALCI